MFDKLGLKLWIPAVLCRFELMTGGNAGYQCGGVGADGSDADKSEILSLVEEHRSELHVEACKDEHEVEEDAEAIEDAGTG